MGIVTSTGRRGLGYSIPYSLLNGLMFNVTWFAIVITESPIVAPVLAVTHLSIHFCLMGKGMAEVKLLAQVTVLGLLLDQFLFWAGVFTVNGNPAFPPLWMLCIWPVLATTFMHAFSNLQQHYVLAAMLGAVGGVASFTAGTGLTAVAFGSEVYGPITMAIVWAVLFPLLITLARQNLGKEVGHHG